MRRGKDDILGDIYSTVSKNDIGITVKINDYVTKIKIGRFGTVQIPQLEQDNIYQPTQNDFINLFNDSLLTYVSVGRVHRKVKNK